MPSQINVTACDNELIVLAYQWGASFELCRVLSGNYNPVNVTLNIQPGTYQGTIVLNGVNQPLNVNLTQTLAPGSYSLLLLGVDWGGPAQFTTTVNGQAFNFPSTNKADGLVFNPGPIPITV
jgi:hypothetical protein